MLVANRIVGNIYSSLRATIFLVRTTVESCKTMSEPENPSSDAVEDVEDEDHGEETGEVGDSQAIANQLMKNPGVLAALQDKLCSIVGSPSGYIQSLPKEVKRRIKALKKLQNEIIHIESEFYKEVNALELKYAPKYSELFEKRKEILIAAREPTDEDCDWASEEEDDEDKDEDAKLAPDSQQGELKDKVTLEGTKEAGGDSEEKKQEFVKGIPSFWLTIFKNVEMLSEMVQEHDEPILTHLQDIKVVIHEKDPVGFTLEFYFEPNEYFTDTVLTKRYEMRYDPDSQDPFSYEGPEIIKCSGCTINWNKGKNVTVKQIKKKQKHKGRGLTRTVTKQVQADSFFNFFNPPAVPDGSESEMDEETEALLGADFEIGHFIRERIIPRAVLFFTGEAIETEDYEDDENDEGEEEDYDEEADPDFNPEAQGKPNECKQQ
ncbi:Nucleosome assembly protein 1-like 1-A [Biomphalaria glabrata]|uniref:Nucleosome assembly protein 1-like 1 isoform X1 n=1 Tax=Biomphalaria glabrata TaxID=6526 RepID=A0A9W3BNQ9_BIOGL|nr:nucleosome assembly protein 1-like 1 isoform X1 [Biomphalaria glabrata]KAI8760910.1 nucleosome assembly protein 1-like 1 isoform X6 [Biomphalaria glabrata]